MRSIHWFRKGLRLHDNPAAMRACDDAKAVYALFILDPRFADENKVGAVRFQFLLDALADLDRTLRAAGTRLFVARGEPREVLPELVERWGIKRLCFEADTEPYAIARDAEVRQLMESRGVGVCVESSHTIWSPHEVLALHRKRKRDPTALPPTSYRPFCDLVAALPAPSPAADAKDLCAKLPPASAADLSDARYDVPSLAELGYSAAACAHVQRSGDGGGGGGGTPAPARHHVFEGGETEGLRRLHEVLARKRWVAKFEKPKTSPTAIDEPSTTALSPYLKFGCVSPRLMWHGLKRVEAEVGAAGCSKPPTSLTGQLLWREFYYTCGTGTPNYSRMQGNPICRQVPWGRDPALLRAWEEGRTGFPWIDACMTQLRTEGWLHHLARHAVACFLTRGDLWQSWEEGAAVFDKYLVDADWSINNGNWMWLSCSCFFYQFFRCYSPVAFPKKYDADGAFVRHYLPVLRKMPAKYIYEPWKAPADVQRRAGCVVGVDYPRPIVDHTDVSKRNMARMKAAYDEHKRKAAGPGTGSGVGAADTKGQSKPGASRGKKRKER